MKTVIWHTTTWVTAYISKLRSDMYGIDILVEEHKNIVEFCKSMKSMCCSIIEGEDVDIDLVKACVAFGKNYADHLHHGKEEKILFKIMLEKLGPVADKLIRNGMLVEHDLGRLHMNELLEAIDRYEKDPSTLNKLDIITNASGYATLLNRHIGKEDEVVYTFAQRALSDDDKERVNVETKAFDEDPENKADVAKYLSWLENFKSEYPAR